MSFTGLLPAIVRWLNANQGVLSAIIFAATIFLGFATGIFNSLRRVPKFKVSLIEGPTFACTFVTGNKYNEFDVHRTAIVLYLSVSNVGSSASSIHRVSVAYHWNVNPFSRLWLKYGVGWFWLHDQVVALEDFRVLIGDQMKLYPFLTQASYIAPSSVETYLEVGRSTCGVVYFEQSDSWGGCYPKSSSNKVRIKVSIWDVFGREYKAKFSIPFVPLGTC